MLISDDKLVMIVGPTPVAPFPPFKYHHCYSEPKFIQSFRDALLGVAPTPAGWPGPV